MTMNARVILIYLFLFGPVYSDTCKPFEISKDNLNKALVGHSVLEILGTNHHECARNCMSLAICKSIDYDRNEQTCKLNDVEKSSVDPSEFETKKGSIFSDINEWPSTMVKSCKSRPCKASQRCYDEVDSFVCIDITRCGMPSIKNANVVLYQSSEVYTATVTCKAGYQTRKSKIKCKKSGVWEKTICEGFEHKNQTLTFYSSFS